jgi:arylsulfatase A-like enzyme
MCYATGQFGKNHLGDKNEFLPTVHGFDEFFGYLYHLDAMEDPAHPAYPQELLNTVGPRNMVHSYATNVDDTTVDPRWGQGRQAEDRGRGVVMRKLKEHRVQTGPTNKEGSFPWVHCASTVQGRPS